MKTKWNKIASYNPQENLKLMEIFTVVEFKKNDYLNLTTTKTTFEENCINPSNTWACAEANGMKNLCSNLKLLSKWQRTPARFIHNNKFNTEFEGKVELFTFFCLSFRSRHRRCSVRKGALRSFAKFTGNCCARLSFLSWRPSASNFIRKEILGQVFSCSVFSWCMHFVKNIPIRSFFWPLFSPIWIEYGDLLRQSPYSVQIRGNTEQKNSVFGHFLRKDGCF